MRKVDAVRDALSRRCVHFEIIPTEGPGHATEIAAAAARDGHDAVVAVGGDGTMNEVLNGLAGSDTRMLVVAGGTGNAWARETRMPADPATCVGLLFDGATVSVRPGVANDRLFLLLASAGFDAEVVERMTSRWKNTAGIAAYFLSGIRHIFRPQPTLWLEFPDRERIEVQWAAVMRGRLYGGGWTIAPGASVLREELHIVALKKAGRWAMARFAARTLVGRHANWKHTYARSCESVNIRSTIPSAAQVDGEYLSPLPARFGLSPKLVKVVVPAGWQG